jgi:N-acetylmuramoyl-L-alanine amidase
MPAVLVELGFITNPRDARLMNEQPELFARGVYEGIKRYTGV